MERAIDQNSSDGRIPFLAGEPMACSYSKSQRKQPFKMLLMLLLLASTVPIVYLLYPQTYIATNYTQSLVSVVGISYFDDTTTTATTKSMSTTPFYYSNCYGKECSRELADNSCSSELNSKIKSGQLRPASFQKNEFMDLKRVFLIVQFNDPHYVVASKTYAIYSRIFGEVAFCGPDDSEDAFWPKNESIRVNNSLVSLPDSVRFAAYGRPTKNQGENGYVCVDLLLQNYTKPFPFDGVLLISDDVVPHYWTWNPSGKSLHKNWMMGNFRPAAKFEVDKVGFCRGSSPDNYRDCSRGIYNWQFTDLYQDNCRGFINELEELAKTDKYWQQVAANLTRVTGGRRRMFSGVADIYYIKRESLDNIRPILQLLSKHRVFMEIGIATAIATVSLDDGYQTIDISGHDYGPGPFRYAPRLINVYTTRHEFLHPFKLGFVFRKQLSPFITDISKLLQGTETRGNYNKNVDESIECLYCYLRNLSIAYSDQFYKNISGIS